MPRPRFTLRTLLIAVAVCAVVITAYKFSPNAVFSSEYRAVRQGMTPEEVRSILGEPYHIQQLSMPGLPGQKFEYELWWYADPLWILPRYGSTRCNITFADGRVTGVRASP